MSNIVACGKWESGMQHDSFLLPGPCETSLTWVQLGILRPAAPCRAVQVLAAASQLQWIACDAIPRGSTWAMYSRLAPSQ